MSSILPTSITPTTGAGMAPIDESKLPADVRKAGPKAERLYETALSFEQMLLQQLTQELNSTTGAADGSGDGGDDSDGDDSDDSDSTDSSSSVLTQMLPNALAQGMTSAGGVGIARNLYDAMKAQAGIPSEGTATR